MPERDDTHVEVWKPIRDFAFYEASTLGQIRSADRFVKRKDGREHFVMGRVLRENTCLEKGYVTVCLYSDGAHGRTKRRLVHALVLETFVGLCPVGMECCHGDGNPRNNRLDNLRWDTPTANQQDRKKHGTYYNQQNKLNETQARVVRRLLEARRIKRAEIARLFGVCEMTVYRVKCGETWRHLGGRIVGRRINKLGPEERQRIKEMRRSGLSLSKVASHFHVTKRAIVVAEKST